MGRKLGRPQHASSHAVAAPAGDTTDVALAVDELIRQGAQAIEEYDYELARTALSRAFDRSGGAEASARPLLTLLVDHLAADREALALGARLSPGALESPDVRLLLALAAARCGERQQARDLVARMVGTSAAEILVSLAVGALKSGELDEAARLCDDARARDPAHPSTRGLGREIARAREDTRRPLDAEITRALAEGAIDEARRLAEGVLARFPESEVARRAVRVAAEQKRAREVERLVKEAEEALAQADVEGAGDRLRWARAALAAGPWNEPLTARLAELEAETKERAIAAKVGDIARRLAEPDLRPGLLLYASLHAEDVRRRVRDASGLPMLDGLEHALGRRAAPQAAVGAILALAAATAMAEQQPEVALAKLAAHARVLAGLPEASSLESRLAQRMLEDRRRKLAELLATTRAMLDGATLRARWRRWQRPIFVTLAPRSASTSRRSAQGCGRCSSRSSARRRTSACCGWATRSARARWRSSSSPRPTGRGERFDRPRWMRRSQRPAARSASGCPSPRSAIPRVRPSPREGRRWGSIWGPR
jgi:hypothetical protein